MHREEAGEIVTGLIYLENNPSDLHENLDLVDTPLNQLADTELCPASSALEKINASLR
jgi:2-oxoglutarate ferredoxin oxidoreductase subunit beta